MKDRDVEKRVGWLPGWGLAIGIGMMAGGVGCSLPQGAAWREVSPVSSGDGVVVAGDGGLSGPHVREITPGLAGVDGGVDPAPRAEIALAPVASPVPELRGYVFTPHLAGERKMVDVRRFATGQEVLCPYTYRSFVVPDFDLGAVGVAGGVGSSAGGSVDGSSWVQLASNDGGGVPVIRMDGEELARRMGSVSPRSAESDGGAGEASGDDDGELPSGRWVAGRPGFVYSPFAAENQLVDVTGVASGAKVRCPYTGRLFRVPAMGEGESGGDAGGEETTDAGAEAVGSAGEAEPGADAGEGSADPVMPEPVDAGGDAGAGGSDGAGEEETGGGGDGGVDGEKIPTAEWVDGRPGLVQSPFGESGQLVDVTGKSSGEVVVCPFSYRRFRVP